MSRSKAKELGQLTYIGRPHSCRSLLKYTINGSCVQCTNKRSRDFVAKTKGQHRLLPGYIATQKRWRANGGSAREYQRNKSTYRKQILRRYGISVEQYEAMLVKQDGKCAICWQPSSKQLSVDHCHVTGKVRKLLCSKCNFTLGNVNENIEILQRMIMYINEFK